jgi:RNase P subunit RPR2
MKESDIVIPGTTQHIPKTQYCSDCKERTGHSIGPSGDDRVSINYQITCNACGSKHKYVVLKEFLDGIPLGEVDGKIIKTHPLYG